MHILFEYPIVFSGCSVLAVKKELRIQKMPWHVASVVTQVEVDRGDPAFLKPTKPIGSFMSEDAMEALKKERPGLQFMEDSGRGYRRVVPSPKPVNIVERESILNLLDNEYIVTQGPSLIQNHLPKIQDGKPENSA